VVVEPAGQLRLDLEQAGSSVAPLQVRHVVGMREPFVRTAEDRLSDHALVIADVTAVETWGSGMLADGRWWHA
jgi:hypothetical protein